MKLGFFVWFSDDWNSELPGFLVKVETLETTPAVDTRCLVVYADICIDPRPLQHPISRSREDIRWVKKEEREFSIKANDEDKSMSCYIMERPIGQLRLYSFPSE